MRKEFSAYLDAVRFTAAMAVVVAHFTFPQFVAGLSYQGALGGLAVSVFFVLSGYVISYVAQEKEHSLRHYAVSRMARVYSVSIPAIILTLAMDFYLLSHGGGHDLPRYEYGSLWKYLPVFLIFGSEIAGFHAPVFGDNAFWSLSYEVWYYVAFGMFFYLSGWPRLIFSALAVGILGLPALIYFPSWILGSLVYRAHQKIQLGPRPAAIGALTTGILLVGLYLTGAYDGADNAVNAALNNWPRSELHNSMNFLSHYMAALLTAAHFFFVRYCRLSFFESAAIRKATIYLSSFTFAIYLAHRPLMDFWSFVIGHDPHSFASVALLAVLTLFSCWCFGLVSEHRKERWRSFFRWLLRIPKTSVAA